MLSEKRYANNSKDGKKDEKEDAGFYRNLQAAIWMGPSDLHHINLNTVITFHEQDLYWQWGSSSCQKESVSHDIELLE